VRLTVLEINLVSVSVRWCEDEEVIDFVCWVSVLVTVKLRCVNETESECVDETVACSDVVPVIACVPLVRVAVIDAVLSLDPEGVWPLRDKVVVTDRLPIPVFDTRLFLVTDAVRSRVSL
jgi:hypothetical protein